MNPTKDLLLKFNYAITFKSRLTRLKRVIFLFVVLVAPYTLGGGLASLVNALTRHNWFDCIDLHHPKSNLIA